MQITTVGLDLAKRIFQVHAVDASGSVVVRKALRRSQVLPFFTKLPSCLIGMEACGTSHHWARELTKLGHEVRMMPPAYVKPYVKRGKNDAVDAEAICEAVTRPTMRFVAMKSAEQQAALSLHRTRNLLVKQRTQLVNMIRGLLAEFGIDIPEGLERALGLARQIAAKEATPDVPAMAMQILGLLCGQVLDTHVRLQAIDRSISALQRTDDVARRSIDDPRHRPGRCHSIGRIRCRSGTVPLGSRVCRLARADTFAKLERRQGPARPHHQDGRPVSEKAPGGRRDIVDPPGEIQAGDGGSSACRVARQETRARGECGHGEQDGPCRLGDHGARRNLSSSPYPDASGVRLRRRRDLDRRKQIEPINRLHEVVRATRCDGETGQAGNRDNPSNVRGIIACKADWDLVRRPHQGQQSRMAASTGRTEDCTRPMRQNAELPLAMREPSTEDCPVLVESLSEPPVGSDFGFRGVIVPPLPNRRTASFFVD